MRDARVVELAGRQFNRVSRAQLAELGLSSHSIEHRLRMGRLVAVEQGVFALPPVLAHDPWGRWMGATLTARGTVLSRSSAAVARGWWSHQWRLETVTRPGSGGPRHHGGLLVFRSSTLEGNCTWLRGIPITSPARTLLDLSQFASEPGLARAVREAIRLGDATLPQLGDALGAYRGRRGCARLAEAVGRYAGLPVQRVRSGAEVRAMQLLRDHKRPLPRLNYLVAGEEADLVWPRQRLIIEIDGGPFHLDAGQDARKQGAWENAGWQVRRLPSDDVYERPNRLLALAPSASVPESGL